MQPGQNGPKYCWCRQLAGSESWKGCASPTLPAEVARAGAEAGLEEPHRPRGRADPNPPSPGPAGAEVQPGPRTAGEGSAVAGSERCGSGK